jgi:DNA-3-methyladenine glycosylase II
MEHYSDQDVYEKLIPIKGIGPWTIDVTLMHALRRTDQFPLGDVALVNSLKKVKRMHPTTSQKKVCRPWPLPENPTADIAASTLWHSYMQEKGARVSH